MIALRRSVGMLLPACVALGAAHCASAREPAPQPARAAPSLLLFEVRLGEQVLSDGMSALQVNGEVFLPLGELARLLTIAIATRPADGCASGFILDRRRSFSLDVPGHTVEIAGRSETIDRSRFRLEADDIYVASPLLARWLPAALDADMAGLVLQVRPREQLPFQARLARLERGRAGTRGGAGPAYPLQATPYSVFGAPFVDQTITLNARRGQAPDAGYAAYATADLLGMQAALYASGGRRHANPALRLALGRYDPDAGLLGPLRARSAVIGNVAVPGVSGISLGGASGNGAAISNRPLHQPARFDRHTLQGDLPPGWDVELYFNDALVAVQAARADGRYSFDDLPLVYGANEFRLVFHGPLGQLRVERQSFLLEQSQVAPGQLLYHVAGQRGPDGQLRAAAQFDVGLAGGLSASGGVVQMPLFGSERRYASAGLRHYWSAFIVDGGVVRERGGGALAQVQFKTRIGRLSLGAAHAALRDFSSEVFLPSADPIRARDELRLDGVLGAGARTVLPVSLQVRRDRLASRAANVEAVGRIAAYSNGTAISNALRWQSQGGARLADGILQLSRRLAGIGVSGQLYYTMVPRRELSMLALAADKNFAAGYQLNAALLRDFRDRHYDFSASLNKSLGRFGLGLNLHYSTTGDYGAGLRLFVALGREPRSGVWRAEALPLANTGSASARVFLDRNLNGVMDGADEAIAGAGVSVNGASQPLRSGADGIVYLTRLPPHLPADIGLDPATLEDPQWKARAPGTRIVPRPGKAGLLEIPVIVTGEVDGTVFVMANGAARPGGGLDVELVDAAGKVAASAVSASDGYFIVEGIAPGRYLLRAAPAQAGMTGLVARAPLAVTIGLEGTILNGRDIYLDAAASTRP